MIIHLRPRVARRRMLMGKTNHSVHFTSSGKVKDLPDDVVIIPISGNGCDYSENKMLYKRFKAVMHISVNSLHQRDECPHPDITRELIDSIVMFSEQHQGIPLVFHCSAGEQRSVALASVLEIYDYRLPHVCNKLPGTNSVDTHLDRCIWLSARKHLRDIDDESETAVEDSNKVID